MSTISKEVTEAVNKGAEGLGDIQNLTRDQIRTQILSGYKPKKERIKFMGTVVEVHQPPLRTLLESQDKDTTADKIVQLMIDHVFVPGTKEKVFEEGDTESLMNLPWNEGITDLQTCVARLSGIDVAEVAKELEDNPLG